MQGAKSPEQPLGEAGHPAPGWLIPAVGTDPIPGPIPLCWEGAPDQIKVIPARSAAVSQKKEVSIL